MSGFQEEGFTRGTYTNLGVLSIWGEWMFMWVWVLVKVSLWQMDMHRHWVVKGVDCSWHLLLLLTTHLSFSHINSIQIFFQATTASCSPWTLWAIVAVRYEWLEKVSIFFVPDSTYSSMYGHCVLGWSHQVHFRNLTWIPTTECEWGNMGLQTLLAVILGLQGEQGLGWGQLCKWQGREEEGWWALHYTLKRLSQPATWSALLLDCLL